MSRERAHAVAATLLLWGSVACGPPTGPSMTAVAGTYSLERVFGDSLPAAVTATSVITVVSTAVRVLSPDGSCRETGTYRSTFHTGTTYTTTMSGTMTCRWSLKGRTITFDVVGTAPEMYHYRGRTTATVSDDGTLTEGAEEPPNGQALYPRVYRR